jgi:uncharacterized membrane protein YecN with MAPEG domain
MLQSSFVDNWACEEINHVGTEEEEHESAETTERIPVVLVVILALAILKSEPWLTFGASILTFRGAHIATINKACPANAHFHVRNWFFRVDFDACL